MSSHLVTTNQNRGSPVLVKPKLARRFYEPIVLLVCLNSAWKDNRVSNGSDQSSEMPQSSELAFQYFLNKLGQLCDNEKGGDTVTAFVVLEYPDHVQYRFASNQRNEEDLPQVQSFIISIIQSLGSASEDSFQEVSSLVLCKSLSFTRPKVQTYVKSLKKYSTICIDACIGDPKKESKLILEKLEVLRDLLCFSDNTELDNFAFSVHCEGLIMAIDRLYRSEVSQLIYEKTNEGRINASEYWCELRHAMGRLVSYLHAIRLLVSARKRWPALFENFEVCAIPSSRPAQCPFRNINKAESLSAVDILGRMTSDPEAMKSYKTCAQELKKFGLDDKIRQRVRNKILQPIVHAEVLLLDSLERDGVTDTSHFFNGYKYIGCSKPTCRLCEYYFQCHRSGVAVRQGHRNLYPNWRTPDVFPDQYLRADKAREKIMNQILVRIREDAIRTMKEKVPERKHHDSNTEPTYPIDSIQDRDPRDIEPLTLGLQHLSIENSVNGGSPSSSRRVSFTASDAFAAQRYWDDREGEDGGVLL